MKKLLLLSSLFCLCTYAQAQNTIQGLPREFFRDIQIAFITDWQYFRMQRNPALSYEETHDQWGQWKIPRMLPDTFWKNEYWPEVKITRWEETPEQVRDRHTYGIRYVRSPFFYIVEKGDGITGIKREWGTRKILDTLQLNVYDSLFPYDNRFLVEDLVGSNWRIADYRGPKVAFYSGNVDWEPIPGVDIVTVALFRGVQFGVSQIRERLEPEITNDSLRRLRPEYPDYVYAIAERSDLSNGCLLIGTPKGKESDYIELIFYTNDPQKTGDSNWLSYYEMRYLLPTVIKDITERRMVKRKLSEEDLKRVSRSYLRRFLGYIYEPEEDEE